LLTSSKGTTQACLFRDNYSPITAAGLSVYGLSTDSTKSNTTFATKQSLPFPLLCDPSATLTGALGMKKAAKSTTRGVVVIDKAGKVQVWEQAGPQKTVDAVMAYVQSNGTASKSAPPPAPASDTTMADAPPAGASAEAAPAKTNDPAPATTTEARPATANEEPPKTNEAPVTKEASAEEVKAAETAAEVGETAAKIDSTEEAKA
jgi:thioredoxin-dependent peroxiredoxin